MVIACLSLDAVFVFEVRRLSFEDPRAVVLLRGYGFAVREVRLVERNARRYREKSRRLIRVVGNLLCGVGYLPTLQTFCSLVGTFLSA